MNIYIIIDDVSVAHAFCAVLYLLLTNHHLKGVKWEYLSHERDTKGV